MDSYKSQLITNSKYKETFESIIINRSSVDKKLYEEILSQYINHYGVTEPILTCLDDNLVEQHIQSLSKISGLRRKLYCKKDLTQDELTTLLLRTRSDYESRAIVTNYHVSAEAAVELEKSSREKTKNALTLLVRHNLAKDVLWAVQGLKLGRKDVDQEITNLLLDKKEYRDVFEKITNGDEKNIYVETRFLTTYPLEKLLKLEKYVLSTEFEKDAKEQRVTYEGKLDYLILLNYALKTNGYKKDEIEKKIDKVHREYTDENVTSSDLDKMLARAFAEKALTLSSKEYEFILKNVGLETSLLSRKDVDINEIDKLLRTKIYKPETFSKYFWLYLDEITVKNTKVKENLYKLLPYCIMVFTHQQLMLNGISKSYCGIRHFLQEDQVEEINELYNKLTIENYPTFKEEELSKIKKRLTYAFKYYFDFNDGVFTRAKIQGYPLGSNWYKPYSIQTVTLPQTLNKYYMSKDKLRMLRGVQSMRMLDSFAMIYLNRDELRSTKLSRDFESKKYRTIYEKEFLYFFDLAKKLDLKQLETAIIMFREWEGGVKDFENMVKHI